MKKLAKALAVVVVVLLVILAAAAVAVRLLLPPAKLKTLAIDRAEKSLHRQVKVDSVQFGLFSGLELRGLSVSEAPDFSRGEFLKAGRLTISPRWLPLLHKELVVRAVELDDASVAVVKDKNGRFNFSQEQSRTPAAPAAPTRGKKAPTAAPAAAPGAPASEAPAFQVGSLSLRNVDVAYLDRQQAARAGLKIERADFGDLRLSGPFSLSIAARADYAGGGRRVAAAFQAKGTVDLAGGDASKASADLRRFSLQLQGRELTGSLRLTGGQPSKLSARVSVPSFDAQAVNALAGSPVLAPGATLPAVELSLDAAYAPPRLDVTAFKATAAGAELSGSAVVPDLGAKQPGLELKAATNEFHLAPLLQAAPSLRASGLDGIASLSLSASAAGGTLTFHRAEAKLGQLDAKLSGDVKDLYGARRLDLRAQIDRFALASLADGVPAMKPYGLAGSMSGSAAVAGTAAAPRVSGSLSLSGVGATYQGQVAQNVSGQARFTEQSLDLPQLTGRLNGGDFRLKLAAAAGSAPSLSVSGWMSLLDLGALQKLAASNPPPEAAPASAAPARPSSAAKSAPAPRPGKAAPAAKPTPPLRTSGSVAVDRVIHPNFQSGKASLSWNLSGVTPDMKRLSGTARLDVGAGHAANLLDFAAAKGGLVRALVAPLQALQKARALHIPGLNVPDMQDVPFTSIQGVYAARDGVVSMQPFAINGPVLAAVTTGTADLGAETVNLKTATKSSLGSIDLAITGPMSDPSVRPIISKAMEDRGRKLLQQEGQKLLNQFLRR